MANNFLALPSIDGNPNVTAADPTHGPRAELAVMLDALIQAQKAKTFAEKRQGASNRLNDTMNEGLKYALGPHANTLTNANALINPLVNIDQSQRLTRVALDDTLPAQERMMAAAQALMEVGTFLAPAAAAKVYGAGSVDEMARGLSETFANMSSRPEAAALRDFGADQAAGVPASGLLGDAPQPRMIVHHNTSPEKLAFTDELGGMPYPSLAISRADAPLENFGGISLIGGPEMATPSGSNRVWPGDGYSVRQPRGDISLIDDDAFSKAFKADERFSHLKDAGYWQDMFDNVDRADGALKEIELAISQGKINPKDYERFDDLSSAARKALGFGSEARAGVDAMPGVSQFGDTQRTLWQGYTPSGNRRKPKPYTLDNVMAEMRADAKNAGGENFNYGASSFRANANRPFQNAGQVSDARGRILPEAETNELFGDFSDKYMETVEKLAGKDARYETLDGAGEYMNDYVSGNQRALREWQGVGMVDNMTPETRSAIDELAKDARQLPANYFEAKPQRAVKLSEFAGAIVPEGEKQALEILGRNGIKKIFTYGSPAERAALFQKFPEFMFSAAAAAMLGMSAEDLQAQAAQQGEQNILRGY